VSKQLNALGAISPFFLDYVDRPQPELLLQEAAAVAAVAHVVLIIGSLVGLLNVMRHETNNTLGIAHTHPLGWGLVLFVLSRTPHAPARRYLMRFLLRCGYFWLKECGLQQKQQ